jgi:hypothetical protein
MPSNTTHQSLLYTLWNLSQPRGSSPLMEPKLAVLCWQRLVSGPSYEPEEFSPHTEILLLGAFAK